jgi:hypothetical protein
VSVCAVGLLAVDSSAVGQGNHILTDGLAGGGVLQATCENLRWCQEPPNALTEAFFLSIIIGTFGFSFSPVCCEGERVEGLSHCVGLLEGGAREKKPAFPEGK